MRTALRLTLIISLSLGLGWFYSKSESLAKKNKAIIALNKEIQEESFRSDREHIYLMEKQKEESLVEGCYKTIEILCSRYLDSKQVKCRNDLNSACQEIL